jgi:hypothetical protein
MPAVPLNGKFPFAFVGSDAGWFFGHLISVGATITAALIFV